MHRREVRRTINPWLVADHTKLLIFDDKTAMLGGMNIGREYFSEWHDMMILVEGPIVGSLARDFQSTWMKAGPWGDFSRLSQECKVRWPKAGSDSVPVRILRTNAALGRSEILKASIAAMHASRKRIWIETPYFSSDQRSVGELAGSVFLPDFGRSKRIRLEETESRTAKLAELLADRL